jgi:uncharacterized protein YjbI with pentapeptide repeats
VSSALDLLLAGQVEAFNARRGQRTTIDLFAADLAGLDLAGVDLSNANLEKADLSHANLRGARLAHADLSGADLTGACMDEVVAVKAKFREAYLGQASAVDAQFAGADFAEADLTGLVGDRASFAGARLKSAVLTRARLVEANLAEARMSAANLREACLDGADLSRVEGGRVDAEGASLAKISAEAAVFPGASFRNANLEGADLTGADLTGADLTGARLDGAELTRADLFEVQGTDGEASGEPLTLSGAGAPLDTASALHPEDPDVSVSGDAVAAIWENAEDDDSFRLRLAWASPGVATQHVALDVPSEQVLARAVLPAPEGRFRAVLLVERTGGVDLIVLPLDPATGCGAPSVTRLSYQPAVTPVVVPDGDAFVLFGIARTGTIEVHRWAEGALTERMRAPAATYRGFCGRVDAIGFTKGGTVVPLEESGIGRAQTAPQGFPGDRHAAATGPSGIGMVWTVKGEKGFRYQVPGEPPDRMDTRSPVGAVDLTAVGERWLAVWTRMGRTPAAPATAWAAWLPDGEPFALAPDSDVDEVRVVRGGEHAFVAALDASEQIVVLRVDADVDVEIHAQIGEEA